jgi:hypothetical protein
MRGQHGEDLEPGGERAQRHLEAHLVVAGGGAAVRDRGGAEFDRFRRHGLRLHGALCADAERVELAAAHVADQQPLQHALEVFAPRVHEVMGHGAERERARLERGRRGRVDAPRVHRDGDDRPAASFHKPGHAE